MECPLTGRIQSAIVAVQRYKNFVVADAIARDNLEGSDWYEKTFAYYRSLPLPSALKKNRTCFETVLKYDIELTFDVPEEDLPNQFVFRY